MGDELRFDGEVVIVTGAGRGMGRAHALDLAQRGASVVVNDVSGADAVVGEIEAAGGTAVASDESVASPAGGASLTQLAMATWGRVDGVVSNAAIVRDRPFHELTVDDIDAVLDVKLRGAFFVIQPAYRVMMAQPAGGRILAVTSLAGLIGSSDKANYAAANAGLVGLVRAIAVEGDRHGIRANLLNPGAMSAHAAAQIAKGSPVDQSVIERGFTPERVTPMVVRALHRSCPCTGQILSAWGGVYSTAAITLTPGWQATDAEPTAEDVVEHWPEIIDQSGAEDPGLDAWAFAFRTYSRLYG